MASLKLKVEGAVFKGRGLIVKRVFGLCVAVLVLVYCKRRVVFFWVSPTTTNLMLLSFIGILIIRCMFTKVVSGSCWVGVEVLVLKNVI